MKRACAASCAALVAACGGRTGLTTTPIDGGVVLDGSVQPDAHHDAASSDASATCSFDGDPSQTAVQSFGACGEGINIASPPTNDCGGLGAAFEYVPYEDVVVDRIELHTDAAVVGLLDSDPACNEPGAVLFVGPLDSSGATADWRGASVFPSITVHANHKYFVWQAPAANQGSTLCSAATSGVDVREYTAPGPDGPWDGPFGGIAWSARLDGVCP